MFVVFVFFFFYHFLFFCLLFSFFFLSFFLPDPAVPAFSLLCGSVTRFWALRMCGGGLRKWSILSTSQRFPFFAPFFFIHTFFLTSFFLLLPLALPVLFGMPKFQWLKEYFGRTSVHTCVSPQQNVGGERNFWNSLLFFFPLTFFFVFFFCSSFFRLLSAPGTAKEHL